MIRLSVLLSGRLVALAALACLTVATTGLAALPPPPMPPCPEAAPGYACDGVDAIGRAVGGDAAGAAADLETVGIALARDVMLGTPILVWTSVNDGAGSGLDADTIDGLDSVQLVRSDASGHIDGDLTVTGTVSTETAVQFADGSTQTTAAGTAFGHDVRAGMVWVGGTRVTVLSASITSTGRPVFVAWSAEIRAAPSSGSTLHQFDLSVDGKAVPDTYRYSGGCCTYWEAMASNHLLMLPAGEHLVEVKLVSSTGTTIGVDARELSVFEI